MRTCLQDKKVNIILHSSLFLPMSFTGGAKLLKELQGFASFVAFEDCHLSGDSLSKNLLMQEMERQYFGNPNDPDSFGLAEQLIHGVGVFSGLYTEEYQSTVTSLENLPNPTMNTQGTVLVLKPELHCLPDDKKIFVGQRPGCLNMKWMLASNLTKPNVVIKARTMVDRAKEILLNCKKALSLVLWHDSPYKGAVATGVLPSGSNIEDYYLWVRQQMYKLLPDDEKAKIKRSASKMTNEGLVVDIDGANNFDGELDNQINDEMPDGYTFIGFIVFALIGPIVPSEMKTFQSHLMMEVLELLNQRTETAVTDFYLQAKR